MEELSKIHSDEGKILGLIFFLKERELIMFEES